MSSPVRVRLLEKDPELGADLSGDAFELARRSAVADVLEVPRGVHDPTAMGSPGLFGLLVLDGLLIRSVEIAGRRCGELVGKGSVMRPWDHFGSFAPMPFEVRWRVISPLTLALLDHRITLVCARWPALMHELVRRGVERSHMLAFNLAIHCLQHVEFRLVMLFWHLADRFGYVTPEGTVVPLKLSHRDLAELVGSQRPSVSTNLAKLAQGGEISRRPDRTWLLAGDPPEQLSDIRSRLTLHVS